MDDCGQQTSEHVSLRSYQDQIIVIVCKVVTLHNVAIDYNPVIGIDR